MKKQVMGAKYLIGFAFLSLLLSISAFAGTVQLPRTGQTHCYDSAGEIPCTNGQDGQVGLGMPWPIPRFVVNGDCVTDNLTGLTWLKNPAPATMAWSAAITYAQSLFACGHLGWRLPNVIELRSLGHAGYRAETCGASQCTYLSDWLNTQGFSNVQAISYWSSTTFHGNSSYAALVSMSSGGPGFDAKSYSTAIAAWPVWGESGGTIQLPATGQTTTYMTGDDGDLRKGVALPSPRFQDNSNGTVTDNLTGLIWLKDANCTETVGGISKGDGKVIYSDALTWTNNLETGYCGLSDSSQAGDWRLPNRNELESLVDYGFSGPAFSNTNGTGFWLPGDPFNHLQSNWYYWTSTDNWSDYYSASATWIVYTGSGAEDSYLRTAYNSYVWPVRREPSYTVSVSQSASGIIGGSVASNPPGINCYTCLLPPCIMTCSADFSSDSIVALEAWTTVASWAFSGWGGEDYDCSDGQVITNMSKLCTPSFAPCSTQIAKIGAVSYPSISGAYTAASSIGQVVIDLVSYKSSEQLTFGAGKTITLRGGYSCDFTLFPFVYTALTSPLTISGGTVTIENIVIL